MDSKMRLVTVGDYIERLKQFPDNWPVMVSTSAGGGIAIEHRDVNGVSVVAVFGANGGRFGEAPLTEDEYEKQSKRIIYETQNSDRRYTTDYGDHRWYSPSLGAQAGCYGTHYDRRIVERMVREGLIIISKKDLERVASLDR